MATANQMRAAAREVMKNGAVVISAADFSAPGILARVQLYFFDGKDSVMDFVSKEDLLENWPDEGVYILNPDGDENSALLPVGVWYDESDDREYIRVPQEDAPCDELISTVPSCRFMDAVEQICAMKEV